MSDITFRRGYPSSPNPPTGTILTTPPGGPNPEPQGTDGMGMVERNLQFLKRPDVQAALMAFGTSAMQGVPAGQTDFGALGTSIARGVNAAGLVQAGQNQAEQQQFERGLEERRVGADEQRAGAATTTAAAQTGRLAEDARQFDLRHELARDQFGSDQAFKEAQLELDGIAARAARTRAQAAAAANDIERNRLLEQARQFDLEYKQRQSEFKQTNLNEQVRVGASARTADAAMRRAESDAQRVGIEQQALDQERTLRETEMRNAQKRFEQQLEAADRKEDKAAITAIFDTMLETNFLAERTEAEMFAVVDNLLKKLGGGQVNAGTTRPGDEARIRKLQNPTIRAQLVTQHGEATVQEMERQLGLRE